jgi:hypothetical protein
MVNKHRGEVALVLGGRRFALRLTLQALAEIETALLLPGLGALGERLGGGRLASGDLIILLAAAIRGGGTPMSSEEIAALVEARDLPAVIEALGALFVVSFADEREATFLPDGPAPSRGAG